jgi:VanZ family protein
MKQGIKNLLEPKLLLGIAFGYTLLITLALLLPITGGPNIAIPFADKMLHLAINAGLLVVWAGYFFSRKTKAKKPPTQALLFGCIFIYGILIEVIQENLIPTRGADFFDVVANVCGLILGSFVVKGSKKIIY